LKNWVPDFQNTMPQIILNECPRDAMQGLAHFVPTETKIAYHNALLKVGFPRLDFGSFVSPKAIPQLRDTADLVGRLDLSGSKTALLAIVANLRGAEQAMEFDEIGFLGFPLSISEQFQQRNTNKSIAGALEEVARIQNLCLVRGKKLVVYLSMAFGNPYSEAYSPELVLEKGQAILDMGISHLSLADTVGVASPAEVSALFSAVSDPWSSVEVTAHLHASPLQATEKLAAAYDAGCRHFDVALGGFGGCPMAEDELVGNLSTEQTLGWAAGRNLETGLDLKALEEARSMMHLVFEAS
jgi:hydroxymethylglutaryl-CoA lyase